MHLRTVCPEDIRGHILQASCWFYEKVPQLPKYGLRSQGLTIVEYSCVQDTSIHSMGYRSPSSDLLGHFGIGVTCEDLDVRNHRAALARPEANDERAGAAGLEPANAGTKNR